MRELPVAAIGMLRVVSFNCDYCHRRIILGMEPSWMRFEPAINAGVAYNIYVGGATGSMGSLQKLLALHKTQEPLPPLPPNSEKLLCATPRNS